MLGESGGRGATLEMALTKFQLAGSEFDTLFLEKNVRYNISHKNLAE